MGGDNTTLVIDFDPSGSVEAMHFDSFPLKFLGRQEINRASELKYDSDTDTWFICVANREGLFNAPVPEATGFASYDHARRVEVAWFNQCRLDGVEPESTRGRAILCATVFPKYHLQYSMPA